jgi:alkylation response protein AidB-like acyl-CoA dehydrogenase
MISFAFTEEQEMIRSMVREFVDKEVKPVAAKIDKEGFIPPALIDRASNPGLLGISFPSEVGGSGAGEIGYCILMEELGRGCGSLAGFVSAHQGIGTMSIHLAGSAAQKKKYLPDLCSGRKIACYALTEPSGGSDAAMIRSTAVKKGDRYVLNGDKVWITNADVADVFIIYAVTDPQLRAKGGITAFIVDRGMKGLTIGAMDDKMGLRGMHSPQIFYDDLEVPEENVLGGVGGGFKLAMMALDRGRLTLGATVLGSAKEMTDLSIKYAGKREAFGKPIIEHEFIQGYLAEMAASIYAMESIVYRTAWMCDQGMRFSRESAIVKMLCTESYAEIVDRALQIHGGMGVMGELPIERFYRDERVYRIFEGTSEIQRIVIARDLAKKGCY